jgi:hypothetical protein
MAPFETCPPILRMSVHRGRPEVAVVRPQLRHRPETPGKINALPSATMIET